MKQCVGDMCILKANVTSFSAGEGGLHAKEAEELVVSNLLASVATPTEFCTTSLPSTPEDSRLPGQIRYWYRRLLLSRFGRSHRARFLRVDAYFCQRCLSLVSFFVSFPLRACSSGPYVSFSSLSFYSFLFELGEVRVDLGVAHSQDG